MGKVATIDPRSRPFNTRDDGLDEERRRVSEQEASVWAAVGQRPFPNMSEAQRNALAGTLHFPPPEGLVEFETRADKD
jgi:hypothetical protein